MGVKSRFNNRERVFNCIVRYQKDNGWAPSVREIAAEVGITPSTTHYWLEQLEAEGWIMRGSGNRQIRVLYK